ncbi:MAG: hypothetical protein V8S84_03010 [Lachnospiraceae bacterium]
MELADMWYPDDLCAKNCPSAIRATGDWHRFKQLIGAKTTATRIEKSLIVW